MMNPECDARLKAPITLISHGRSGTSLLQNIFNAHPDIAVTGETTDLIFSTWYSIQKAQGIVPGCLENGKPVSWEERSARSVRSIFNEMFNIDKKYWMQKPIAQPFVISYLRKKGMSLDEWFELYWNILEQIFPQGKFMTILRQPCDVVLSAGEYWGREQVNVWRDIATMARCILHPSSKINLAVSYDELVQNSEVAVKKMFEALNVEYHPNVLGAFNHVYVPDKTGWKQEKNLFEDKIKKKFSRQEEWDKLDLSHIEPEDLEAIQKMWNKFGYDLKLPLLK